MRQIADREALSVMAVLAAVTAAWLLATVVGELASAEAGLHVNGIRVTATTMRSAAPAVPADPHGGKTVSDAEMLRALDAVVACVSERGHDATLVEFTPGVGWHIAIDAPTSTDAELAAAALDACSALHGDTLDAYWAPNLLTPEEQAGFEAMVRECLRANGVEPQEGRSLSLSVPIEMGDVSTRCRREAMAALP